MSLFGRDFEKLLVEAVDDGLSVLGDSAKQAIYYHLEKSFNVKKEEIPSRMTAFTQAIENIFGVGANFVEILIMKKLHVKIGVACKWQYCKYPMTKLVVPEVDFQKYVDLMREIFEAKNKDGCTEIGVFVCE